MALTYYHPTREAADSDLAANGFTLRASGYWGKASRVDEACGGFAKLALVSVEHRAVTGGPDYFELRFA